MQILQFKATDVWDEIQCAQKHQLSGVRELQLLLLNKIPFLWS